MDFGFQIKYKFCHGEFKFIKRYFCGAGSASMKATFLSITCTTDDLTVAFILFLFIEMAEEEVKTLFLSGLPDDIKEREIYHLFRNFDGYESCQLKYSGRGYQVFLNFRKDQQRYYIFIFLVSIRS